MVLYRQLVRTASLYGNFAVQFRHPQRGLDHLAHGFFFTT